MKLLIFGGSGLVGSRILELSGRNFDIVAPTHEEVDLLDEKKIVEAIDQVKADQILYAAGFTNVDLAEEKYDLCNSLNSKIPAIIAEKANKSNTPFFYLSTDYVFGGTSKERPYTEEDEPDPVDSVYAKSKLEGEKVTLSANPKNCIIRLIMPFSGVYKKKLDLARLVLTKLQNGEKIKGIIDQKINPVFVDDLVSAILKLLEANAVGIYHTGAADFTSPNEFIKKITEIFKLNEDLIEDTTFEEFAKSRPAKRPQYSWLDTNKFRKEFGEGILRTIDEEIVEFKTQLASFKWD